MQRLLPGYTDAITKALTDIPQGIRDRLRGVDLLCGVDAVFAGLHRYEVTADDRSYRDTAHCVYGVHQDAPADRRRTTVVLPTPQPHPFVIVHELGHALDEVLGFGHRAAPVSDYARTDRREAFAEAFRVWVGWVFPGEPLWPDDATRSLLDGLA